MGNQGAFKRAAAWCLALTLVGAISVSAYGDDADEGDALDRGRTLYQLALALEVDSAAMRAARDAYEDAASDPRLATAAQAGIDQTADRLENSDEMFRNVWSGIWQLRGDHGAFELYDSHVELALDRAWSRVVGQITIRGIPRAPVYPRCAGDDESCGILRDMVLLSSHGHNRLREVTDDELRRYLGPDLTMGSVGEVPRAVVRQRLLGAMPESTVLVADIQVHPDVLAPDPVSRVSVSLMKWDLQKDTYAPIAFSEDVGIDVIPRWRHAGFLWLIVLALMVFLGISTQLFRGPSTSTLASVLLVIVGVAWAFGAREVIDGWLPAMDDLAWDPDQNPLFGTWLWPFAQGVVLAAGPLAIGFLAVWTARARAAGYVDLEALKLKLVTPPIMAGTLLATADHLPILFGTEGALQFAGLFLGMLAPGTVAGWTAGEMLEEGLPETRQGVAIAISLLAGVACFFFYGLGTPVVIFSAVGASGAVVGWFIQRGSSQISAPVAASTTETASVAVVSGDLSHPEHVDRDGAPVTDAMEHHDAEEPVTLVVVRGISGSGKTRYANELLSLMAQRKALEVVRAQAGSGSDVGGAAPYAALSLLLRNVLPVEALHSSHEKREALVAMARDVGGGALEAMPGVGLLMGVLPDEEAQTMTQDRLARDVEVAVRQQLDQKEQVWFLDDAQLADAETLGLLEELVRRLQDDPPPHSLRLVISEQTGEGDNLSDPLHKALETLATSVDLEPLNDDELSRFLQSSGVAASSSQQRTWVTERAQRPGDVLSVLRHLVAEGETDEADGQLVLPPDNRLQEIGDVIPTELVAREEARLSRLASDDLVMLEMAAQCGRRFEADDLVRGLGESRFAILERLRRVELQTGILMDVDEADVFAFELEGTRQALLQRTRRREGPGESLPEIAREFHLQVARHLKERRAQGERVAAERVIAHARQAGPTMQGELSRLMIEAAEDAAKVFSWGRCLSWTDQATELGVAGLELRERLRFVRARAKMSIGGQDNRDDARGELRALVDAEHVDARRCLRAWLEVFYGEKQQSELEQMLVEIDSLKDRVWSRPWMNETLDFYETLVQWRLEKSGGPRETIEALYALRRRLDSPPEDENADDERYRELLLGRLENECANTWQRVRDRSDEETSGITAHLERSIALKEPHGDLEGLAASYGVLGNFYMWTRPEPAKALENYRKDLEIIDRAGSRFARPSLLNRMGMASYDLAVQGNPVDEEGVAEALANCGKALSEALNLGQENDAIFAAGAAVRFGCEQDQPLETWVSALEALEDPSLIDEGASFARGGAAGLLRQGAATLEDDDLKRRVLGAAEILSPEQKPEA